MFLRRRRVEKKLARCLAEIVSVEYPKGYFERRAAVQTPLIRQAESLIRLLWGEFSESKKFWRPSLRAMLGDPNRYGDRIWGFYMVASRFPFGIRPVFFEFGINGLDHWYLTSRDRARFSEAVALAQQIADELQQPIEVENSGDPMQRLRKTILPMSPDI